MKTLRFIIFINLLIIFLPVSGLPLVLQSRLATMFSAISVALIVYLLYFEKLKKVFIEMSNSEKVYEENARNNFSDKEHNDIESEEEIALKHND